MTNNELILSMLIDIESMLESDTSGDACIKAAQKYVDLAKTVLQIYERNKEERNKEEQWQDI